jgi:hypothetical protein
MAVIALVAFVPAASAAKAHTALTFDGAFMTNGASIWSGDVVSKKKCANKRVVLIFKVRPGADKKMGSTKAAKKLDGSGYTWAFEKVYAVKSSERYYAKVNATSKCKGARSPVLNAVSY